MKPDAYLLAALADDRRRKARIVKGAMLQADAQRTHEPTFYRDPLYRGDDWAYSQTLIRALNSKTTPEPR